MSSTSPAAVSGECTVFGVRVVVDSMRKSVSMNNLSQYRQPYDINNSDSIKDDDAVRNNSRRNREIPWTEEEHKLFLDGLQKVGKGDWRGISREFVKTRTPLQVASHAEKYFLRQTNLRRRRRRPSLFDITTDSAKMYDVLLSFRGEDTRAKFITHLYSFLENAGIYVFKDDDGIQRGDQISISLLQAISRSKISVVVLSRNFANSKWCMMELERIVEIGRTKGMVVVPVFYEVDPSEVRHQTGKFGESFEYLISTISVDEYTIRNWKTALYEVGGIAGIVIINSRIL